MYIHVPISRYWVYCTECHGESFMQWQAPGRASCNLPYTWGIVMGPTMPETKSWDTVPQVQNHIPHHEPRTEPWAPPCVKNVIYPAIQNVENQIHRHAPNHIMSSTLPDRILKASLFHKYSAAVHVSYIIKGTLASHVECLMPHLSLYWADNEPVIP